MRTIAIIGAVLALAVACGDDTEEAVDETTTTMEITTTTEEGVGTVDEAPLEEIPELAGLACGAIDMSKAEHGADRESAWFAVGDLVMELHPEVSDRARVITIDALGEYAITEVCPEHNDVLSGFTG